MKNKPIKIFKGSDLVISLCIEDKLGEKIDLTNPDLISRVDIKIFTPDTPPKYAVSKSTEEINPGNIIKIDDSELAKLNAGVIYIEYDIEFFSDSMEDGVYNVTKVEQTNIILQ